MTEREKYFEKNEILRKVGGGKVKPYASVVTIRGGMMEIKEIKEDGTLLLNTEPEISLHPDLIQLIVWEKRTLFPKVRHEAFVKRIGELASENDMLRSRLNEVGKRLKRAYETNPSAAAKELWGSIPKKKRGRPKKIKQQLKK